MAAFFFLCSNSYIITNMKVIRSDVLGFCFGVRRAVEEAEKALIDAKNKVYSLGPLIHNEAVLEKLSKNGLNVINEDKICNIEDGSVVIIRAHGVEPFVIQKLNEKNCQIIDATCPRVKANQKMAEKYSSKNNYVILSGDNNHGEVKGVAGYAGQNFRLVQNPLEAKNLELEEGNDKEIVLLSQTTFSRSEFETIAKILQEKFSHVTVKNTICPATSERQTSLLELCKKVDGVLVIGGKSSANTKRLFQIANENAKNACLIQNKEDIPKEFFSYETVGLTAGASTPDDIIEQVENTLLLGYNK